MIKFSLLLAIWIMSCFLAFGILNGNERRGKIPIYNQSAANVLCGKMVIQSLGGPISLGFAYLLTGFSQYGVSWNCKTYGD